MEILKVDNLTFSYPNKDYKAIKDINLSVDEGDFVILSGYSGSGKTTLLKCLKPEIRPTGGIDGNISYNNEPLDDYEPKTIAKDIGYLFQEPSSQIVTDKVINELAFSMENLGFKQDLMERRIAELSSYFGLEALLDKNTSELSGGQMQMLNLASILTLSPKLLLLDEPTAMLDPVASESFINMVKRINKELGITIVYSTHEYSRLLDIADKMLFLKNGEVISKGDCYSALKCLIETDNLDLANANLRIWNYYNQKGDVPKSLLELRGLLKEEYKIVSKETVEESSKTDTVTKDSSKPETTTKENSKLKSVIKLKNAYFRYNKNSNDILKEMTFNVNESEVISIVGANGSGKSTLLGLINGSYKAYSGKVKILGESKLMPQLPELIFTKDKVKDMLSDYAISLAPDFYDKYKDEHPYDLSGGEKGLLAFLILVDSKADILLLDEPSKGMDKGQKQLLIDYIAAYKADNKTVVIATHDLNFAAKVSDKIAMIFDKRLIGLTNPKDFYKSNIYYKTYISRAMTDIDDDIYLEEQIYASK
ncbi:MAG: ATP-binding cassette domain-containing protein [Lachnospiraceae bacterium]|nr:ATP-binding cassette domain-containing protein [Lachnospiraceae bacterium]